MITCFWQKLYYFLTANVIYYSVYCILIIRMLIMIINFYIYTCSDCDSAQGIARDLRKITYWKIFNRNDSRYEFNGGEVQWFSNILILLQNVGGHKTTFTTSGLCVAGLLNDPYNVLWCPLSAMLALFPLLFVQGVIQSTATWHMQKLYLVDKCNEKKRLTHVSHTDHRVACSLITTAVYLHLLPYTGSCWRKYSSEHQK